MSNPLFNTIKIRKPGKSAFNLSHEVKLSCQFGALIPIFCQEALPGDTFKLSSDIFIRMAPMLAPIMHRVDVYTHFFAVPMRLIWDDWEDFITGGRDGLQEPVFPQISDLVVRKSGSLQDYLGYPTVVPGLIENENIASTNLSALPLRAYHLIWNEYYRDQNLSVDISDDPFMHQSGVFADEDFPSWFFNMRYRSWEKDYFTSALPWAQRGAEATIPIASTAPVGVKPNLGAGAATKILNFNGTAYTDNDRLYRGLNAGRNWDATGGPANIYVTNDTGVTPGAGFDPSEPPVILDNSSALQADLSSATAATINELRRAFALQRFLERNAVGGARYIEQIMAHFGVASSDARLQRPEYLGGGKSPVQISEVLQTSQTTNDPVNKENGSVLGDMAGRGISVGKTHSFSKFFEEHCIVMGIMSILPRSAYMQGVSRFLTKFDKYDYYFPEFAHLGEQEVLNKELFLSNTVDDDKVFGYQSRYAEYKFCNSRVHGKFKSDLNYWHLARIFNARPNLNSSFTTMSPAEAERIFPIQVQDETDEHFYIQVYNNFRAVRPIPKFSTPGI